MQALTILIPLIVGHADRCRCNRTQLRAVRAGDCDRVDTSRITRSLRQELEIQRTGDLFFPKRWTDATLNGHGSASAASLVQRFLQTLPADYPDRLRRVVLSSSDELFRASGVPR